MAKNRVIPFGYCMKNGVITTDPKEVCAVATIFSEYLSGKSLLQIGHKIHRTFAVIFHNFVSDTVGGKRFLKERVAYILFVL